MTIFGLLLVILLIALLFNAVPVIPQYRGDSAIYTILMVILIVWLLTRLF